MSVLVTGGAGYIGSAVTAVLIRHGYEPVRMDVAPDPAPRLGTYLEADVRDHGADMFAIRRHNVTAVVHMAGLIAVAESVRDPLRYWDHNVGGTVALLKAMGRSGVRMLVFSSSAAVYGEPKFLPITEDHPTVPQSPYGRTKWAVEQILQDVHAAEQLDYVALRYFNAAGAMAGVPGERHDPETHLIPNVVAAARGGPMVAVYGTDYQTADGTAVRDYVHIQDLAEAHVLALQYLEREGRSGPFNIANSRGYSVREVISQVRELTHREVPEILSPRRPGDPAILVGASDRARRVLGWTPRYETLRAIVQSVLDAPPEASLD